MPAAQGLRVDVVAGPAFETLVALYARTPESERWLHLLGLALERPDDIAGVVAACDPHELRRHLVGVHVPAWRALVGPEALEAAALGETSLLDHDRYYAGRARVALAELLPLSAEETKERILGQLAQVELDPELVAALAREAEAKRRLSLPPEELIDLAAGGYRYEPEPEIERVVLVPHAAARPWLLLCQHERTRIICYPLPSSQALEERALALGRALGDGARIRMLRRLAQGEASLTELAETAGVARSTAHHHLSQLRAAGLVSMRGNARAYRFGLRAEGFADAQRTLAELVA